MLEEKIRTIITVMIVSILFSGLNCRKKDLPRPELANLSTFNIRPENSVLLIIEFQKTWTERGFFHWLIEDQYHSRKILRQTIRLAAAARENGYGVIQAPLILDKSDRTRYSRIPFFPKLMGGFTNGTWKTEFTEGVSDKSDIIVSGRCGFDATECSDLEEILKKRKIKNVFFCGFTTDHCVDLTIQTLVARGYNTFLVSDCTATRNEKIQKEIEARNRTIDSRTVITLFEAGNRLRP